MRSKHTTSWVGTSIAIVVMVLLWELAAFALDGSYVLAGPLAVAGHITDNTALLGRALGATLRSAALGYISGNLVAVALACIALGLPRSERAIRMAALVVFCLPLVATGPILRVLYGPGIGPQVTLAALSVFYTTLVPLLAGLRATPGVWLDLVGGYGRGRWAALVVVRAMVAGPYLFAGLQIAAPAAFLGALVGEFTGAERGLGVLTLRAMRSLDVDATWAIATIAATVSISAYALVGRLGRILWPDAPPILLSAPPSPRKTKGISRLLTPLLLVIGLGLLWYGIMEVFALNRFFAKRPDDLWVFLVSNPNAAAHRETLAHALSETLATVFPGYMVGLALGGFLAALSMLLPRVAGVILPLAVTLRAVPIVTTAPLIVMWLGRDTIGVVTIVAVMVFFPTLIACLQGLRQAPGVVLDVFDSYAAGRCITLLHARIPAALPAFFASARMAVPAAVLAGTVAEWLASGTGVGHLMALAASTSDYSMLWSAIVALTAFAALFNAGVAAIEHAAFARYAPEQLQG